MPYFTTCYSVIQDDDGLFKVWYSDFVVSPPCERPLPIYSPPAWSSRLCYAFSEDGVHFEKPALGQVEIDGEDTNVVRWNEGHGCWGGLSSDKGSYGNGSVQTAEDDLFAGQAKRQHSKAFDGR